MKNKRLLIVASGYSAFAVFSLLLSLYLTFDYDQLKPLIKNQVGNLTRASVDIGSISSYRLSGVTIKNLKLQFPAPASKGENSSSSPSSLTLESIRIRLKILPLLIGRKSLSFAALLAGGKMKGNFSQKKKSLRIHADLENLTLDRIPLTSLTDQNFRLGGKLKGQLNLVIPDTQDPSLWKGDMDVALSSGKAYPFLYNGIEVPEISFSSGQLQIKLRQGKADINPLKLESPDLPIDLKASVDLRIPLNQSFVDLSGTIKPGTELQKQVPFITTAFSPDRPFSYKGNIEALLRTF
jgi:type II secretion system protein N